MTPRIGCLFSGYGGLSMAVQQVYGGEHAWFCEFDPAPSRILAHHWPEVPNHQDVTTVDWSAVEPVDVLTGGFPCQDVSVAGRRAGMTDGTRSGLWSHMVRAIDTLRPGLVVIENVGGLFSATADSHVEPCEYGMGGGGGGGHTVFLRAIDSVLGTLSSLGYDAEWTALRAADVGAPHGRLRVFITAHPADTSGGGSRGRAEGPQPARRDHAPVGSDPRGNGGRHHHTLTLLPTPAVNDMGAAYTPDQWDEWTDRMRAEHGNGNGHGKSLSVEALRMLPTPRVSDMNSPGVHGNGGQDLRTVVDLMPTPSANLGANGGSQHPEKRRAGGHSVSIEDAVHGLALLPTPTTEPMTGNGHARHLGAEVTSERFGPYAPAIERWEQVLGRPAPAPTEPGKTRPRLSARFVEWLMGLPEGHVTDTPGLTRNQHLKALGNGVVPLQAATALTHLDTIRRTPCPSLT